MARTIALLRVLALAAAAFAGGAVAVGGDGDGPKLPAAEDDTPKVDVALLAEHTSVKPGGTASLLVRLDVAAGWHVYWRNPGDAGVPPRAEWTLPQGYRAGPLRFPVPTRHVEDPIVTFVHEGTVLLPVDVLVPATAKPGEKATLTAKVTWLACKDMCVDGSRTLSVTLPVAEADPKGEPATADAFRAARRALPQKLATDELSAVRLDRWVAVSFPKAREPLAEGTAVRFFPDEDAAVTSDPPEWKVGALTLKARRDEPRDGDRLRGVLVIPTTDGRWGSSAWEVDVPIVTADVETIQESK